MNVHEGKKCLSLEDCYDSSINLQIYGSQAKGKLYLDDGITVPVLGNLFEFSYEEGRLEMVCLEHQIDSRYLVIKEVQICGQSFIGARASDGSDLVVAQVN
jgi:hypothetical protein